MKLAELERTFWTAVREVDGGRPDSNHNVLPAGTFVDRGALSARSRLGIYRDMYFYRQREALRDAFPVLARALGSNFRALADDYVLAHPSEHPALEWLGRELPSFVARVHPDPVVADVAALEWAHCQALLAPDPSSIASACDVDAQRFPSARLRFVPSLFVVSVRPAALALLDPEARVERDRVTVAYARRRFRVFRNALDVDEARALVLTTRGHRISSACAAFGAAAEPVARAFQVFAGWLDRQWIEAILQECSE